MTKKKSKTVAKPVVKTSPVNEEKSCCCNAKWSLVPLRFALGLMFLDAGLPKLFSLIGGNSQIPGFFAGIGIPLAGFSAWLVAIIEVVGGLFLLLGLFTWWTGLLLGIIMVVATLLTTLSPLNWGNLTKHLLFIAALVAVMYGSRYFSFDKSCGCCCKK
jgi:putative oxidoreductase